jgi:prepilin-type N-terminal cleavage/methylation domain-containing protein
MKKNGFTVIEAMIALAILAVGTLLYVRSTNNTIDLQRAQALKDQTQIYAKLSANYLVQNESQLLPTASSTTPIVIPFNQVIASGITPLGLTATNLLNQMPCISVLKNQNGRLEAIMYFVSNTSNTKLNEPTIMRAILGLSGIAGEYKNGDVKTATWQIPSGNPYYIGANQCVAGYTLMDRNIVVNLNLIPEFNQSIQPDIALHRIKDRSLKNPGQPGNKNTSLSDITFNANKGVVLNNSMQTKIVGTGNTLNIQNGDLMASTVQSTQAVVSGTACLASELSKVAMQNDPNTIGVIQSNVTCVFNPLVCGGSGYCYLPVTRNTVTYNNSSLNGALGSRFTCPANLPYLVSATAYQSGGLNPTIQTITSSYAGYTMPRGAIAVGDPTPLGCKTWSFNYAFGCTNWGGTTCSAGSSYRYPGSCGTNGGNAVCDGVVKSGKAMPSGGPYNCWGLGCAGKDWKCIEQDQPSTAILKTVTCTSDLIIQAN